MKTLIQKMNKRDVSQKLYLIGFLLYAVEPVIEYNDVFFYFLCAFALLCILLGAGMSLSIYLKDKEKRCEGFMKSPLPSLDVLLVVPVGLMACYTSDATRMAYFWWLLLALEFVPSLVSVFGKRK